jgi:hypothetical protein
LNIDLLAADLEKMSLHLHPSVWKASKLICWSKPLPNTTRGMQVNVRTFKNMYRAWEKDVFLFWRKWALLFLVMMVI